MKAAVRSTYGSPHVVCVDDAAKPVPRVNDPLIKVRGRSPLPGWCALRRFQSPGEQNMTSG
jgi:hypothetical protein